MILKRWSENKVCLLITQVPFFLNISSSMTVTTYSTTYLTWFLPVVNYPQVMHHRLLASLTQTKPFMQKPTRMLKILHFKFFVKRTKRPILCSVWHMMQLRLKYKHDDEKWNLNGNKLLTFELPMQNTNSTCKENFLSLLIFICYYSK